MSRADVLSVCVLVCDVVSTGKTRRRCRQTGGQWLSPPLPYTQTHRDRETKRAIERRLFPFFFLRLTGGGEGAGEGKCLTEDHRSQAATGTHTRTAQIRMLGERQGAGTTHAATTSICGVCVCTGAAVKRVKDGTGRGRGGRRVYMIWVAVVMHAASLPSVCVWQEESAKTQIEHTVGDTHTPYRPFH